MREPGMEVPRNEASVDREIKRNQDDIMLAEKLVN